MGDRAESRNSESSLKLEEVGQRLQAVRTLPEDAMSDSTMLRVKLDAAVTELEAAVTEREAALKERDDSLSQSQMINVQMQWPTRMDAESQYLQDAEFRRVANQNAMQSSLEATERREMQWPTRMDAESQYLQDAESRGWRPLRRTALFNYL